VVGGGVTAVLIAVLIMFLSRWRRRRRRSDPSNKSFLKEQAVHIQYQTGSGSTVLQPGYSSGDPSFDLVSRRTMDSTLSNVTDSSLKGLVRARSDGSERIPMSRIRDAHHTDLVTIPQADNAAVIGLSTSDLGHHHAG
jgi:hypothetical protein